MDNTPQQELDAKLQQIKQQVQDTKAALYILKGGLSEQPAEFQAAVNAIVSKLHEALTPPPDTNGIPEHFAAGIFILEYTLARYHAAMQPTSHKPTEPNSVGIDSAPVATQ